MRTAGLITGLRQHKFLVGSIGLLLLINIAAFLWIKEKEFTGITKLHQAYEEKRKARIPQKGETERVSITQSKEDILRFVGSLPDKLTIPDVMQEVLELLAGSGLPRVNMSLVPETSDFPGLMRYTTSFSIAGSYPGLKSFLADLQNSKTLFCIEGFALANQTGEETGAVTLQLKLAFYLRS